MKPEIRVRLDGEVVRDVASFNVEKGVIVRFVRVKPGGDFKIDKDGLIETEVLRGTVTTDLMRPTGTVDAVR